MTSGLFGPVNIRVEFYDELRKLVARVNTLPKTHALRQRLGNIHGNASMQSVVNYAIELLLESLGNNPEAWTEEKPK